MEVPNSSTGLGVSMASMLFDSKDSSNAADNGTQPRQAFPADLSQHFASLSLQTEEARARSGAGAMYDQQPTMGMFAGAHVTPASPRPGHGEEVHIQPQMAMPQHPHIPYFPIYPHMMPPTASDVRYVPVDATHAGEASNPEIDVSPRRCACYGANRLLLANFACFRTRWRVRSTVCRNSCNFHT